MLQVWRHAIIMTSEIILEGLSKIRARCTVVGRAQMSADLQEAVHALRTVAPVSRETTAALEALLFLNDGYIKVLTLCCSILHCTLSACGCRNVGAFGLKSGRMFATDAAAIHEVASVCTHTAVNMTLHQPHCNVAFLS